MSSNPTNPEQACPDCEGVGGIPEPPFTTSDMHPYGGLVVCFTCGGTGKIDDTPAPVDQPDELEQRLHKVFDDIYRYGGTGKAGARMVMGIYEPIIAREREASYAEGWRHGKFLEKNRHILHLRYMLDGYPSDAPEYTYVKSLFEREIAALTKGEETSQ